MCPKIFQPQQTIYKRKFHSRLRNKINSWMKNDGRHKRCIYCRIYLYLNLDTVFIYVFYTEVYKKIKIQLNLVKIKIQLNLVKIKIQLNQVKIKIRLQLVEIKIQLNLVKVKIQLDLVKIQSQLTLSRSMMAIAGWWRKKSRKYLLLDDKTT